MINRQGYKAFTQISWEQIDPELRRRRLPLEGAECKSGAAPVHSRPRLCLIDQRAAVLSHQSTAALEQENISMEELPRPGYVLYLAAGEGTTSRDGWGGGGDVVPTARLL